MSRNSAPDPQPSTRNATKPSPTRNSAVTVQSGRFRDRVVELRRVKASQLLPNPQNWRRHPAAQQAALRGVLGEVGYADALLARETSDGLMLIDGHLRAGLDPEQIVPVIVLDVTETEADLLLASLDPIAGMAETDRDALVADANIPNSELLARLESLVSDARPVRDWAERADSLPDLTGDVLTRRGDVWQLGPHRLGLWGCDRRDAVSPNVGTDGQLAE
jgi:hypothetical protein